MHADKRTGRSCAVDEFVRRPPEQPGHAVHRGGVVGMASAVDLHRIGKSSNGRDGPVEPAGRWSSHGVGHSGQFFWRDIQDFQRPGKGRCQLRSAPADVSAAVGCCCWCLLPAACCCCWCCCCCCRCRCRCCCQCCFRCASSRGAAGDGAPAGLDATGIRLGRTQTQYEFNVDGVSVLAPFLQSCRAEETAVFGNQVLQQALMVRTYVRTYIPYRTYVSFSSSSFSVSCCSSRSSCSSCSFCSSSSPPPPTYACPGGCHAGADWCHGGPVGAAMAPTYVWVPRWVPCWPQGVPGGCHGGPCGCHAGAMVGVVGAMRVPC